jgi:hypothetical protein
MDIECERPDLGNVSSQRSVDTAALDAQYDTKVNGYPFHLRGRPTIGTPVIALVGLANNLQQAGGVFLVTIAVVSHVAGPSSNRCAATDTAGAGARAI